jgi:hypothetical protein
MKNFTLLIISLFLLSSGLIGQTTVTLGTGATTNGVNNHPTPYGSWNASHKIQYLILASDLNDLGITGPSNILAIGFEVAALNNQKPMNSYSMKIKNSDELTMSADMDNVGLTEVWFNPQFMPVVGWNTHTFDSPFFWDGQSGILVDVCFDLSETGHNSSVYYTATPGINTARFFRRNDINTCDAPTGNRGNRRANMQITYDVPGGCLPPVLFNAYDQTPFSAVLDWADFNDPPAATWDIEHGPVGFVPTGIPTFSGVGKPFTITGLSPSTEYSVYIRTNCGEGENSAWAMFGFSSGFVSSVPYLEQFLSTDIPENWNTSDWMIGSARGVRGNRDINIYKNLNADEPTGNFTTGLVGVIESGNQLLFDVKFVDFETPFSAPAPGAGNFTVSITTDFGVTYTDIETVVFDGTEGWQTKIYDLSAFAGEAVRFQFSANRLSGNFDIAFDNIEIATCPAPINLRHVGLTENNALLGWDARGDVTSWNIEWGAGNFAFGEGNRVNGVDHPFPLFDLSSSTNHSFYVQSVCDDGSLSAWTGPVTFRTPCTRQNLPLEQTFSSFIMPSCWPQTRDGNISSDRWGPLTSNSSNAGGSPREARASGQEGSTGISRLISPGLATDGMPEIMLEFKTFIEDVAPGAVMKAQYSSDLYNWFDVPGWSYTTTGNTAAEPFDLALPITENIGEVTYFAWTIDGDHGAFNFWYLDDVYVTGPIPVSGIVSSEITQQPIPGATVKVGDYPEVTADNDGFYRVFVEEGTYNVEVSASYFTAVVAQDVEILEPVTLDFALALDVAGQQIMLPQGGEWGFISSYLDLNSKMTLEDALADIADQMVIMVSPEGFFWPGQNINTLGNWDSMLGYKIKMAENGVLVFQGENMAGSSVTFPAGFHIIPILSQEPVDVATLFSGLDIEFAFDLLGNLYWPLGGIFTLNTLYPGYGYLVKFSQETTLNFNNSKSGSIPNQAYSFEPANPWNPVAHSGEVHLIAVSETAIADLQKGDIIGVFNSDGMCTGAASYAGDNKPFVVAAYANDFTTAVNDGMMEGEALNILIYRNNETISADPVYSFQAPNADGLFAQNGLSLITSLKGSTTVETILDREVNIYPNPSTGLINIEGISSNADIMVVNMHGRIVFSGNNAISKNIDLSAQPKGVYFVKIMDNEKIITRKIVIN